MPLSKEHALHPDAALSMPPVGAAQEGRAGGGRLARMQLGVGEPAVIVDRDVQVLPARAAAAVADLGTEDALAERPEASELLDVDVQQLAWSRALVAAHGPAERTRQP